MKAILITGAAGFIGSHTADRVLASTGSQIIGRRLHDVLVTFQAISPSAVAACLDPRRASDIHDSCGDPCRARRDLGFSASVSLEEGLRRMIQRTRKALLSA